MPPGLILPLTTARLVLRDFRPGDEAAIHAFSSDPEVAAHMFFAARTESDSRRYLQRMLESQQESPRMTWELAVLRRGEDWPIGACDLTLVKAREADLGYLLGREAWGQGFATELARALVSAGFEQLGLERIFAICEVTHIASAHVLEKAGLRYVHTLAQYREAKGRSWDMSLYELLRGDWRAPG
jgi:RimJ/RimL family protein N-acetyltransferase